MFGNEKQRLNSPVPQNNHPRGVSYKPPVFRASTKGFGNMSKSEITIGSLRAIMRQVEKHHAEAQGRADELEQLIDGVDAELSFVAIEVNDALREWQEGLAKNTVPLEDLNAQFHKKNTAVEDGWALWQSCDDWVHKTRKRVSLLLGFLGGEVREEHHLLKAINDLKKRQKAEDMDLFMNVVECLHLLREMVTFTLDIETRMTSLKQVCEKRAEEVKAPAMTLESVA